uniref:Uncharacterized protein n=1 Tax=Panagrolaimus superbus TaxID=310955 RepID=A0A914Y574_9BILA
MNHKGILAEALRHQTPPDYLVDLPGAVPRPPPRLPPLPSINPMDPSTSRASHYSPEELEFRKRCGILSLGLAQQAKSFPPHDSTAGFKNSKTSSSPPRKSAKPPLERSQQYVIDSSDDESRGGMLGALLSGRKRARTLSRDGTKKKAKTNKRRMSQGDITPDEQQPYDYGSGILGTALQRFSTRESLADSKGVPQKDGATTSGKPSPSISRSTSMALAHHPANLSSVTGDGKTVTPKAT